MAKGGGSFWAHGRGLFLIVILAILGAAAAGSYALVYTAAHPPRDKVVVDPADLMLSTEEAIFQASDGVPLSGWFVRGRPGWPVIILCHDLGGARATLVNSAVALNRRGYPLLLFDFRGHGQSGGKDPTFGIKERLDVLGGIEYLRSRKDVDASRFGIWGIGMGAYAGLLAAAEDKAIVALALDSLYPDVATELDRRVKQTMPPALHPMMTLVRLAYDPYFSFQLKRYSALGAIGELASRNVMFIASSEQPERYEEAKGLYAALPEASSGDKNFLELRASVVSGLYAEDKKKYDDGILNFFSTYLAPQGAAPPGKALKTLQVLEK